MVFIAYTVLHVVCVACTTWLLCCKDRFVVGDLFVFKAADCVARHASLLLVQRVASDIRQQVRVLEKLRFRSYHDKERRDSVGH